MTRHAGKTSFTPLICFPSILIASSFTASLRRLSLWMKLGKGKDNGGGGSNKRFRVDYTRHVQMREKPWNANKADHRRLPAFMSTKASRSFEDREDLEKKHNAGAWVRCRAWRIKLARAMQQTAARWWQRLITNTERPQTSTSSRDLNMFFYYLDFWRGKFRNGCLTVKNAGRKRKEKWKLKAFLLLYLKLIFWY